MLIGIGSIPLEIVRSINNVKSGLLVCERNVDRSITVTVTIAIELFSSIIESLRILFFKMISTALSTV
jgi:hypothetical protein